MALLRPEAACLGTTVCGEGEEMGLLPSSPPNCGLPRSTWLATVQYRKWNKAGLLRPHPAKVLLMSSVLLYGMKFGTQHRL